MKNGNRLEAIRYITLLNSITFHGGQSRLPRVHATGSIRIAPPSQWLDALLRRDRKLGRGDREKAATSVLSRCDSRGGRGRAKCRGTWMRGRKLVGLRHEQKGRDDITEHITLGFLSSTVAEFLSAVREVCHLFRIPPSRWILYSSRKVFAIKSLRTIVSIYICLREYFLTSILSWNVK